MAECRTIAVVTTYRRPRELDRLLQSINRHAGASIAGLVVVDNAGDRETEAIARTCTRLLDYLPQGENLGHGAGHAAGIKRALREPWMTHCLLLDDDAVVTPRTMPDLAVQLREQAGVAVPLLEDAEGRLRWFPGHLDRMRWRVIREPGITPAEFVRRCGADPVRFDWAPWGIMLLSRSVIESVGLPRRDFGFSSDDIEYALRITARFPGWLIPSAVGGHLPPKSKAGAEAYYIHCLNLQNLTYVALGLPHGQRIRRYLPGHVARLIKERWWRLQTWCDVGRAIWWGCRRGPAGIPGNDYFRRRWNEVRGA